MASAHMLPPAALIRNPLTVSTVALAASLCFSIACDEARAQTSVDAGAQPYFVIGGWAAAVLFLGLGLFLLRRGLRYRGIAAASALWPTALGTVTSSEISKRVGNDEGQKFDYFVPVVTYDYKVDGTRHQGNTIKIGLDQNSYPSQKVAADYVARYPVGSTVQVRYDPRKPEFSLLEIGEIGGTRRIVAGVLLTIIGIAGVVFAIWSASLPTE